MQSASISSDEVAFNSTVSAFARAEEWEQAPKLPLNHVTWEATHLLAEMMSKEIADVISYNSSMKACEHAWPQALHVCLGRLSCIGL